MTYAGATATPKDFGSPPIQPRTEWLPIGALRLNPRNPRTHSNKQIKQIAASIRKFGFLSPLIVDENNMVLAGHGRLEAARLEGLTPGSDCLFRPSHRGAKAPPS